MALTFSVILPVYNAQQTIVRTVNSILNQRFRDFELLVVDDGSTDDSGQILEQFANRDKRIKVFHKENGGANSARNLALQYVQSEYVTFCDADDWVEDDWLQNFADNLQDNDVVVQGWTYVSGADQLPQCYAEMSETPAEAADVMSLHESFGFLWNKCFKTCIIKDNSLMFNVRFRFLEDEEFICRYWTFVKNVKFVQVTSYQYLKPDFEQKYQHIDNYYLYVSLLENASKFIHHKDSITMQKYTMGVFRCIMLSFENKQYREGWNRLKQVANYNTPFGQYNKYLRLIRLWNYPLWFPVLTLYTALKK